MTLANGDLFLFQYDALGRPSALGKYVKASNGERVAVYYDAHSQIGTCKIAKPDNTNPVMNTIDALGQPVAYKLGENRCPCFGDTVRVTTSGISICNFCASPGGGSINYNSDTIGGGNGSWLLSLVPETVPPSGICLWTAKIGTLTGNQYYNPDCTGYITSPVADVIAYLYVNPIDMSLSFYMQENLLDGVVFSGNLTDVPRDNCSSLIIPMDPGATCFPDGSFWSTTGTATITAP